MSKDHSASIGNNGSVKDMAWGLIYNKSCRGRRALNMYWWNEEIRAGAWGRWEMCCVRLLWCDVTLIKCSCQRVRMVAIICVWGVRSQTNDWKLKGTTRSSVTWKRSGVFSLTGRISTRVITPRHMTEIIMRLIVKCWSVIVRVYIWRHVGNSVWRCHLRLLDLVYWSQSNFQNQKPE